MSFVLCCLRFLLFRIIEEITNHLSKEKTMSLIRQLLTSTTIVIVTTSASVSVLADDPNSLTDDERKAGFEILFNGKNLEGWKHANNWTVEDGAIARTGRGGSLTYQTKKVPDDFELRFQWKVGKGSNSGVYYRPGQYEYQILDNGVHRDGKNPRTSAASLYFCMAPSHDATNAIGQWNSGRVICKGSVIQHWLNGKKVIDFDYTDSKWASNVDLIKKRGADLAARGGSLFLQDHGDPVWYRGIKLRTLDAEDKLDRTPITPAKIPDDVLKAEQDKLKGILERRKNAAKAK